MDINNPRPSEKLQVGPFPPIAPRARVTEYVTLELPREMAEQLRAMLGSLCVTPSSVNFDGVSTLHSTNRFPQVLSTQGYVDGPFFTPNQVHGVSVMIHNALRRQGV